mmetsp:Transcript_26/g.95  ORF Transcript_26/g.95 Transcript_26/m.95 type:complete len:336 (-) Transcript_26:189-1196(-)
MFGRGGGSRTAAPPPTSSPAPNSSTLAVVEVPSAVQDVGLAGWRAMLSPTHGLVLLATFVAGYQLCRVLDIVRGASPSDSASSSKDSGAVSRKKTRRRKKRSATPRLGGSPRSGVSLVSPRAQQGDEEQNDSYDEEDEDYSAPASTKERRIEDNEFVLLDNDDEEDDEADDALYSASKNLRHETPRTHCKLVHGKLDLAGLVDLVRSPFAGAIVTFSGTTRNSFQDKVVTELEYHGYESMAVKKLEEICDEMRKKWPDILHVAIEHKLGDCPVEDTSVIIAISSAHRAAALEANDFAINTLKERVPIWKKEKYLGRHNEAQWKANPEFAALLASK